MNGLLPFLALVVSLLGLAHGQFCPPPEVMAPCICRDDFKEILCINIEDRNFHLKETFDRASEYIGEDAIFDRIFIRNITSITQLEEGALQHLKVKYIFLENNPNLEWISLKAFGATRNVTTLLSMGRNGLHNATEAFQLINSFPNLESADLYRNHLTSIPANALQNLPFLESLDVTFNNISQLGSRAFAATEAPSLMTVRLLGNAIPAEGLNSAEAFEGMSSSALVDLTQNNMEFLEQKSYQLLLDTVGSVKVGVQVCTITPPGCRFERVFDCDERADWICDREDVYRPKLENSFACKRNLGFVTVWDYCAARTNSNN